MEKNQFKSEFKKFKKDPIDWDSVLDFRNINEKWSPELREIKLINEVSANHSDLIASNEWKCYEILRNPGLIFIRNPFRPNAQRYWTKRCLNDFPKKPNKTNICNNLNDLRWVTFGYHHNWDNRIYNFDCKSEFPKDLANLCQTICSALNYTNYQPEAAIVNYYVMNSTMYGHVDRSEPNLNSPLISISFGQSAIFLIGGENIAVMKPTAIRIDSGDIIIMSAHSRICYHGLPKVIKTDHKLWLRDLNDKEPDFSEISNYLETHRININIRQVF